MAPQRKKAKTQPEATEVQTQQDPSLHPDLAAQSQQMDPAMLHPDLQPAAVAVVHAATESVKEGGRTSSPRKQRKNAAAASAAAAAAAAAIAAQMDQELGQHDHVEEPVSVDTAAEFLRTIQERESQKNLLVLAQDPAAPVPVDQQLPDLTALQQYSLPMQTSYQGYPSAVEFNVMMDEYLGALSPKKQTKALLTQQMYDDVLTVLLSPDETKVGTAQFRFWAKKMFKLVTTQVAHIVIHENKPVAVKEQLYDVLVQCHGQANHGGRDKTAGQVRKFYSWVPKDLIAKFVKGCPSCVRHASTRDVAVAVS
jgi:hypothetical protein